MPWKTIKHGSKWQVVNAETGHVIGTHDSKREADAQRRAVYANTGKQHR